MGNNGRISLCVFVPVCQIVVNVVVTLCERGNSTL